VSERKSLDWKNEDKNKERREKEKKNTVGICESL
jgi:hypothetical protein